MKKDCYLKPLVEQIEIEGDALICDSPRPGENEGIEYDNWG